MRRFTLAMTLGLGLAFVGCGPTADPADSGKPTVDESNTPTAKAEKNKNGVLEPGTPENVKKGMESPEYRNQPGSGGPGTPARGDEKPKAKDNTDAKPADDKDKKDEAPAKPAAEGDKKKDTVTLTDDEIKNIKMLPAEDQKLAMDQKICAVGEDDGKPNHLGAMGTPVKEVVKGKTVFLCCKSCVDDLKKDPDKYLAKIGK